MKLHRKILIRPFARPIVTGFCALYLVSMLLCTYLMKLQYDQSYAANAQIQIQNVRDSILSTSSEYGWDGKTLAKNQIGFLNRVLSLEPDMHDKYQPFSMALYDYNGNLVAQTGNLSSSQVNYTHINGQIDPYPYFNLSDYLSEDEILQLARYQEANYDFLYHNFPSYEYLHGVNVSSTFPYVSEYQIDTQTCELEKIIISEAVWETEASSGVVKIKDKKPVWEWTRNPENSDSLQTVSGETIIGYFPYLGIDFSYWKS